MDLLALERVTGHFMAKISVKVAEFSNLNSAKAWANACFENPSKIILFLHLITLVTTSKLLVYMSIPEK